MLPSCDKDPYVLLPCLYYVTFLILNSLCIHMFCFHPSISYATLSSVFILLYYL